MSKHATTVLVAILCLGAGFQEFDLELSIADGLRLSDQLIHPLLRQGAVTALVHIGAVGGAGRAPIDEHTKRHRCSSLCRSHHEVRVPRMEPDRDPSWRLA